MRKKFLIQKKKQDTRNKKIKDFYPEQEKKDKEKEKIDSFEDIFFEHLKNHTKKTLKKK